MFIYNNFIQLISILYLFFTNFLIKINLCYNVYLISKYENYKIFKY